jgi:hypothetical protein
MYLKLRDFQKILNPNYTNFLSHTPKSCLCIKIHRKKQLKALTVPFSQSLKPSKGIIDKGAAKSISIYFRKEYVRT